MDDPCIVQDTVDRDSECGNPIVKFDRIPEPLIVMPGFKKMWRKYENDILIIELKRLTKSTAPKRHYNRPHRKGRK
jgi:hypothetical protein